MVFVVVCDVGFDVVGDPPSSCLCVGVDICRPRVVHCVTVPPVGLLCRRLTELVAWCCSVLGYVTYVTSTSLIFALSDVNIPLDSNDFEWLRHLRHLFPTKSVYALAV